MEGTLYREIQTQITHEVKVMNKEHWDTLAPKACQNTKDPPNFWNISKNLMGSYKQTVVFLYTNIRYKVDSTEEMEFLHREFWEQNFQISRTNNTRFNHNTETEVTLHQYRRSILLEQTGRLNNLTEDSSVSTLITPKEIRPSNASRTQHQEQEHKQKHH